MLVSVVATDRSDVEAMAHAVRDQKWVSIRLARKGGDFATVHLSISVEAARELVAQLPGVIEDAERLVTTGEQEAADA